MKKILWRIKGRIAFSFLSRLNMKMRLSGIKRAERRRFWKSILKTYDRDTFRKILKEI